MNKVIQIYEFQNSGGIGYSSVLFKYRGKYYYVDGSSKNFKKLIDYLYQNNLLEKPYRGWGNFALYQKKKKNGEIIYVDAEKFMKLLGVKQ